jgi:hypothetical protein
VSILTELGLHEEDLHWQDLAACKNLAIRYVDEDGQEQVFDPLFENYENDSEPYVVRTSMDEVCFTCPVQKICYDYGVHNKETGVYGGLFLTNGRVDKQRNNHKNPEAWKRVHERVGKL